jgi:hypothetical protein
MGREPATVTRSGRASREPTRYMAAWMTELQIAARKSNKKLGVEGEVLCYETMFLDADADFGDPLLAFKATTGPNKAEIDKVIENIKKAKLDITVDTGLPWYQHRQEIRWNDTSHTTWNDTSHTTTVNQQHTQRSQTGTRTFASKREWHPWSTSKASLHEQERRKSRKKTSPKEIGEGSQKGERSSKRPHARHTGRGGKLYSQYKAHR